MGNAAGTIIDVGEARIIGYDGFNVVDAKTPTMKEWVEGLASRMWRTASFRALPISRFRPTRPCPNEVAPRSLTIRPD